MMIPTKWKDVSALLELSAMNLGFALRRMREECGLKDRVKQTLGDVARLTRIARSRAGDDDDRINASE